MKLASNPKTLSLSALLLFLTLPQAPTLGAEDRGSTSKISHPTSPLSFPKQLAITAGILGATILVGIRASNGMDEKLFNLLDGTLIQKDRPIISRNRPS